MKVYLVVLAWVASTVTAAASASLPQMLNDAYACSDASLQVDASSTCDPASEIAAAAVAKCRNAWDAIADKALGPLPANGSLAEHAKAVTTYATSIEVEYTRVAELKALNIRTTAGRCGFE